MNPGDMLVINLCVSDCHFAGLEIELMQDGVTFDCYICSECHERCKTVELKMGKGESR